MEVDNKTARLILSLLPQYQEWQIEEFVTMSSSMTLLYYYVTTIDEEVAHIWPQKRTMGKILFLVTRYTAIVATAFWYLPNWRTYMTISLPGCRAISNVINIFMEVARTCAEATLWLCLYALLGGKPKHLWILIAVFLALTLPQVALELANALDQEGEPIKKSILDEILGYACNYIPGRHPLLEVIGSYFALVRTSVALLAGLVTIFKRYRQQNHNLIKVIKQEGGFYYIGALVSNLLRVLWNTLQDKMPQGYGVLEAFGWSFLLVFVDRLILQMRKVDDPGTQVALSTLMFNHGNPARESGDSSDPDGSGDSMEAVAAPQDAGGLLSARAAEKRPCDPSLA